MSSASKENKDTVPEFDAKTQAVFHKKGYIIMSKLGSGAFGEVYKAKSRKLDDFCAVKVMNMEKMSEKVRVKFLPRELAALMEVKHPNAVRVFDIIRSNYRIYIFMEYAGNGDMAGYVKKHKILREPLACIWFTQTSEAVSYLHNTVKMSHRDIKLDNILLDDNYNSKLTDFGFANLVLDDSEIDEIFSETFCGTVPYYCPQLAIKQRYNPFKADVWAMGVVLYAMLNNRYPFHFQEVKKMYKEQTTYPAFIKSRFLDHLSKYACDLMLKLLDPNETTRLKMELVLKHEWVLSKGQIPE